MAGILLSLWLPGSLAIFTTEGTQDATYIYSVLLFPLGHDILF